MVEVMCEEKLLIDVVSSFTEPLQDLEALPVELDLLTEVTQLSRELFNPGRHVQGWIQFSALYSLRREFEN